MNGTQRFRSSLEKQLGASVCYQWSEGVHDLDCFWNSEPPDLFYRVQKKDLKDNQDERAETAERLRIFQIRKNAACGWRMGK